MKQTINDACVLLTAFFLASCLLLPPAARADLVLQKIAGMMNDGNNVPAARRVLDAIALLFGADHN
jgi:hypothetical protein